MTRRQDMQYPSNKPTKATPAERVASDVEEFLARGGRIERLPLGATLTPLKKIHGERESPSAARPSRKAGGVGSP